MPPKKHHDPNALWTNGWIITINLNQTSTSLIKPLEKVWDYITSNMAMFCYGGKIIKVMEQHKVWEKGSKYSRIHMHTKLIIDGFGLVSLDYKLIENFINYQLSQIKTFKGIFFGAKLIKGMNQERLIKQYLEKAPLKFDIDDIPEKEFELLL